MRGWSMKADAIDQLSSIATDYFILTYENQWRYLFVGWIDLTDWPTRLIWPLSYLLWAIEAQNSKSASYQSNRKIITWRFETLVLSVILAYVLNLNNSVIIAEENEFAQISNNLSLPSWKINNWFTSTFVRDYRWTCSCADSRLFYTLRSNWTVIAMQRMNGPATS